MASARPWLGQGTPWLPAGHLAAAAVASAAVASAAAGTPWAADRCQQDCRCTKAVGYLCTWTQSQQTQGLIGCFLLAARPDAAGPACAAAAAAVAPQQRQWLCLDRWRSSPCFSLSALCPLPSAAFRQQLRLSVWRCSLSAAGLELPCAWPGGRRDRRRWLACPVCRQRPLGPSFAPNYRDKFSRRGLQRAPAVPVPALSHGFSRIAGFSRLAALRLVEVAEIGRIPRMPPVRPHAVYQLAGAPACRDAALPSSTPWTMSALGAPIAALVTLSLPRACPPSYSTNRCRQRGRLGSPSRRCMGLQPQPPPPPKVGAMLPLPIATSTCADD